jgi:isobutyryl-CoA mutase
VIVGLCRRGEGAPRSGAADPVRPELSAAGAESKGTLTYLQQTARHRKNVFSALMQAVKTHSLGQISHALYEVGGEYRRNM